MLGTGLQLRVQNENLILLFLNQNIWCGYSKEPSQGDGSFEHPKHILKLMGIKENIYNFMLKFFVLCALLSFC